MTTREDELVERLRLLASGHLRQAAGPILTEAVSALTALSSERDLLVERVKVLEQALEAAKPRYAQPCHLHEYIAADCPDCGKLA